MSTPETQKRRLNQLLRKLEPDVEAAFRTSMSRAATAIDQAALIRALETGAIFQALELIRIDGAILAPLENVIRNAYLAGTTMAVETLPKGVSGSFGFDVRSPSVEDFVSKQAGELIQGIQEDTLASVRRVILEGQETGRSSGRVAREITGRMQGQRRVGGIIGLTEQQTDSIIAGRAKLLSGDPALMKDYMNLRLRDVRKDGIIKNAIKEGRGLTANEVDNVIEAHRSKALGYRGRVIAKDQSRVATSMGRDETYQQLLQSGQAEAVTVRWQHNLSKVPREQHVEMNGTVIQLGERFEFSARGKLPAASMRCPHDPEAPAYHTIGCHCIGIYRVKVRKD